MKSVSKEKIEEPRLPVEKSKVVMVDMCAWLELVKLNEEGAEVD